MNPSIIAGSPATIPEALVASLRQAQARASALQRPVLASAAQPVPLQGTPLDIFAADGRPGSCRTFWARPSEDFWLVGVGSAITIAVHDNQPLDKVGRAYGSLLEGAVVSGSDRRGVGPVFMVGTRFDTQTPRGRLWADFPNGLLVLPRFLFTTSGGDRWLTVNTVVRPGADPEVEAATAATELEALAPGSSTSTEQPHLHRETQSTPEEWTRLVQHALRVIEGGQLTKVVLARTLTLHAEGEFSLEIALGRLARAYPGCAVFALDNGGSSFVGASPEVLVRLERGILSLSCLAGTRGRSATPEEDQRLARELLCSAKDQREHAVVVAMVAETLGRMCGELRWDGTPQVITLPTVHHLATLFRGRLKGPSDILRLVEMLHPTPAVGGVPTQRALETIRQLEGDRGWYAAPVGWVDHNGEGEFNVAIRSALISANQATLFAGSGIVEGSEPDREMAETNLKFQPLRTALCRS